MFPAFFGQSKLSEVTMLMYSTALAYKYLLILYLVCLFYSMQFQCLFTPHPELWSINLSGLLMSPVQCQVAINCKIDIFLMFMLKSITESCTVRNINFQPCWKQFHQTFTFDVPSSHVTVCIYFSNAPCAEQNTHMKFIAYFNGFMHTHESKLPKINSVAAQSI